MVARILLATVLFFGGLALQPASALAHSPYDCVPHVSRYHHPHHYRHYRHYRHYSYPRYARYYHHHYSPRRYYYSHRPVYRAYRHYSPVRGSLHINVPFFSFGIHF